MLSPRCKLKRRRFVDTEILEKRVEETASFYLTSTKHHKRGTVDDIVLSDLKPKEKEHKKRLCFDRSSTWET